jgi:hypothetical protein
MMDAAKSFANFTGAFDKVERDPISSGRLAKRMQGQLRAVQEWADALKRIKGNVSDALYQYLLNLGPSAVDEIVALSNDNGALQTYAGAWQQKADIAAPLGAESAQYQYKADMLIQKQVNTFNVSGADPQKVADIVVARLRLAGVR